MPPSAWLEHARPRSSAIVLALRALALWVALVVSSPAHAQEHEREATYEDALQEGVEAYGARDWHRARAAFRRAHAMKPTARTWRALGLAAYELGLWPDAVRALERSLSSNVRELTAAQRTEVGRVLARARMRVGAFLLRGITPESTLEVDGQPHELDAEARLILPAGRHTLVVKQRATEPWRHQLRVVGGEQETLQVEHLPRPTTPTPPEYTASKHAPAQSNAPSLRPKGAQRAAWTLMALGASAGLAAVPFAVLTQRQRERAERCSPQCTSAVPEKGQLLQRTTNALAFGATALLAVGLVAWGVSLRGRELTLRASPDSLHLSTAF